MNIISGLEISANLNKNNLFIWKYVQNKGNVGQNTFLDFVDISR